MSIKSYEYPKPVINPVTTLKNFYSSLSDFESFKGITDERAEQIFSVVEDYRKEFIGRSRTYAELQSITAEKVHTRPKTFDLNNDDEKVAFYINMIDKYLQVLGIWSECVDKETARTILKQKFGIYDPYLIKFEKAYNERFKVRDIDSERNPR